MKHLDTTKHTFLLAAVLALASAACAAETTSSDPSTSSPAGDRSSAAAGDPSPSTASDGWELTAAPPTSTEGTSSHGQETFNGHPQPWTPPPLQPTPGPRPDQW